MAAIVGVEFGADFRSYGDARRHGKGKIAHLGEVGTLAAEKISHAGGAFGHSATEAIYKFRRLIHLEHPAPLSWKNRPPPRWLRGCGLTVSAGSRGNSDRR